MVVVLSLTGLFIVLFATIDVLITTLTVGGAGPLTGRISSGLWWIALRIHKQRSNHRMLATAGWIILLSLVVIWIFLTWFGWTLVFSASDTAVVQASNKTPASLWERSYFTGFTISTLGMGDYQPQGTFWKIATEEFWEATKQVTHRRQLLLSLLENDGWTWEAVASTKTTNRATSLDDETIITDAVLH